jgi:hypothetical protein
MGSALDNFGRTVRDGTCCALLCAYCKVQVIAGLPHVCGESIITTLQRMIEKRRREILENLSKLDIPANDNAENVENKENEVLNEKVT